MLTFLASICIESRLSPAGPPLWRGCCSSQMDRWSGLWSHICGLACHPDVPGKKDGIEFCLLSSFYKLFINPSFAGFHFFSLENMNIVQLLDNVFVVVWLMLIKNLKLIPVLKMYGLKLNFCSLWSFPGLQSVISYSVNLIICTNTLSYSIQRKPLPPSYML